MPKYVMLVLDDNVYRRLESLARRHNIDVNGLVESIIYYFIEKVRKVEQTPS